MNFNINFNNWVEQELEKIPILAYKKEKTYTLTYILNKMIDQNDIALEFGVYKGTTINLIAKYVELVYGFDSFEGLPEDWSDVIKKGQFKMDTLPKVDDNVILIKGLFQDTLDIFLNKNKNLNIKLIHIDCDLYSSALYVLNKLIEYNILKSGVIIVFDEIINYYNFIDNGELLALYDTLVKKKIKYEWIGTHGKIIKNSEIEKYKLWTFKDFRNHGYQQEVAIKIS